MSREKEINDKIALEAVVALSADGFESKNGYCLRWVRQVVESALGADSWPIRRGADAGEALTQFASLGAVLDVGASTIPGDICFWVGPQHGKHGHVAIRVYGNKVAENSSYHVFGEDVDARGTRKLQNLGSSIFWVRLSRVRKK
jgi:hypothetical protein